MLMVNREISANTASASQDKQPDTSGGAKPGWSLDAEDDEDDEEGGQMDTTSGEGPIKSSNGNGR